MELNILLASEPIRKMIEAFNQEAFGSAESPFGDDPDEARRWIEEQKEQQNLLADRYRETHSRYDRYEDWLDDCPMPWQERHTACLLTWYGPDGGPCLCRVVRGSILDKLREKAVLLAGYLKCPASETTMFILTGHLPTVSPFTYQLSRVWGKGHLFGGAITMTIRSPDISPDDVRRRYAELREQLWGKTRTGLPFQEDLELARFYAENPEGTWEQRRRMWNREHPTRRQFNDDEALRRACQRALARVERQPDGWLP